MRDAFLGMVGTTLAWVVILLLTVRWLRRRHAADLRWWRDKYAADLRRLPEVERALVLATRALNARHGGKLPRDVVKTVESITLEELLGDVQDTP